MSRDADDDYAGETDDEHLARTYAGARLAGRRRFGLAPRTRSSRSPAASRAAQRWCASNSASRSPPRRPASRSRRRRASRSTCPASATRWAAQRRDQPGQPALGQCGAGRRAHAPRAEPEGGRRATAPAAGQGAAGRARERGAGVHRRAGPARRRRATVRFAESLNRAQLRAASDIDFRRGQDGAGRVVVDLPNNQVGVDIRQQGQNLVVEFLRSTPAREPAPPARRDRLRHAGADGHDVQSGDRVRMVIEPQRRLGAQRLPERQPVRARGPAAEDRPEQADAGRRASRARSCR